MASNVMVSVNLQYNCGWSSCSAPSVQVFHSELSKLLISRRLIELG